MEVFAKQIATTKHIVFVKQDGVELYALLEMLVLALHAKMEVHAHQPRIALVTRVHAQPTFMAVHASHVSFRLISCFFLFFFHCVLLIK